MSRQPGGWQVISPATAGVQSYGCQWRWSASGGYGMRGESGFADTKEEALQLAKEAYERLNSTPMRL